MADAPTLADDPRTACLDLCHHSPETVRLLRAALDNGIEPSALRRTIGAAIRRTIEEQADPGDMARRTLAALDYLVKNPRAGKVRWLDGGGYDFVDRYDEED